MPNKFGVKGLIEMRARLRKLKAKFPDEVGRALYTETQIELNEVKRRTPVDKGPLRASEFAPPPVREGRKISTRIVAGGPAAPYAIYVHEDPDAFHPVGQWKYIESVLMESRAHMAARVAKRIELYRALAG